MTPPSLVPPSPPPASGSFPSPLQSRHHGRSRSLLSALTLLSLLFARPLFADDGYRLWLKYSRVAADDRLHHYLESIRAVVVPGESATLHIVRNELKIGLSGLLGTTIPVARKGILRGSLVVGTRRSLAGGGIRLPSGITRAVGREGYVIRSVEIGGEPVTVITADKEIGLLYGTFHLLRLLQTQQWIDGLDIVSAPRVQYRLLDHWDNLDGTVERGYAGRSLWQWDELPSRVSPRYADYARANASIGINGSVLNNVNANPRILTTEYLRKVAAIADVLRPYGIRTFLSVNFSSPTRGSFEQEGNRRGGIGDLDTADPRDGRVRKWWKRKAQEIYRLIPDFGGLLVKASSEGMPGPQDFDRTHSDGANMLAEALRPYGGIVMWRSFVYDAEIDPDRVKRAYKEFVPLDGKFAGNVFVQAKNGPLDFQPREPVQPLFGAMPKTPLMLELQITQEYLGHSTFLVYLAPMWKEYLEFDTYANGPGSTLASIIDGSIQRYRMTGIAGVANTGNERNWCGHLFAQANWYAFGRLAWDHTLSADAIADEWIRMTLSADANVVRGVRAMMMDSWEACVNTMTPLGLHHIMQVDFHYGPGPQHDEGREDWRSTYYHRADTVGIGFDRSSKGSNAVSQYPAPLRQIFDDPRTCPEKYLLWFHHVPWDRRLQSGRTLWEELCNRYYTGVDHTWMMLERWQACGGAIDPEFHASVSAKLQKQHVDASLWRDVCLKYFQQFSRSPIVRPEERSTEH